MVSNAGYLTLVGTLIIFAITFWLMRSTKSPADTGEVAQKIYGMRTKYFVLLIVIIVLTLFGTLRDLPYYAPGTPEYHVSIEGSMWYWNIKEVRRANSEPTMTDGEVSLSVEAGKLVEFNVTTIDVNHGIGIYNSKGQLLTQTQAMPDHPAKLYYTFEEPGTYHILCMEYCGMAHQSMKTTFTVQ